MKFISICSMFLSMMLWAVSGFAYPLDGEGFSGIARVEGYRLANEGKVGGPRQPAGALLGLDKVDLRLSDRPNMEIPAADKEFTSKIVRLLGREANRYGIAVLDLSNPDEPVYAEHRGNVDHNPGSVGKIMVVIGLFQALADVYPDNTEARLNILRTAMVTADEFIRSDEHKVPFWNPAKKQLSHRILRIGDRASLYTYLDWMLSASSNAAASMVIREILLIRHFGKRYPVSEAEIRAFFRQTPKQTLSDLLVRGLRTPLEQHGFDTEQIRQGNFFTARGKQIVPGRSNSRANARSLMQFLMKLEQGKIVDTFSSREIKRLLYMTQRRIRYASSPALSNAAVYFKSGSLYKCRPEPGFSCGKYKGNVRNLMNSVAIVEWPAETRQLHYMVVIMSDVLRKNSAVVHQTLGTRIQRLLESSHASSDHSSPQPLNASPNGPPSDGSPSEQPLNLPSDGSLSDPSSDDSPSDPSSDDSLSDQPSDD